MKQQAKKKSLSLKELIIILSIATIIIVPISIYCVEKSKENKITEEFTKEGYKTSKDDAFYRKIVTGNTLASYYEDISNKVDTQYQEYYYSKESNDFIELKMIYKNEVTTTLNISSDIETNLLTFNYELTYKDAHLILDGNSEDNYECEIVVNKKVSDETVQKYCDMIIDEINNFNSVKEELLKNKKINNITKK